MRKIYTFLAIISCLTLQSCNTSGSGQSSGSPIWATYPYTFACTGRTMFPPSPPCVDDIFGDNFEYSGEFNACRVDVTNYELALRSYYSCATDDVKQLLENVNQQVIELKQCFDVEFADHVYGTENTHNAQNCPVVNFPEKIGEYSIMSKVSVLHYEDTLDFKANVPSCARTASLYPKDKLFYDISCKSDLEDFLNPSNRNSAQSQYNKFSNWLQLEINARVNEVVTQFNCMASNGYACSMRPFY